MIISLFLIIFIYFYIGNANDRTAYKVRKKSGGQDMLQKIYADVATIISTCFAVNVA